MVQHHAASSAIKLNYFVQSMHVRSGENPSLYLHATIFGCLIQSLLIPQEASRRCKMEFLSRPDDKKPRWVITEKSHEPQLIKEANMEEGSNTAIGNISKSHDIICHTNFRGAPKTVKCETFVSFFFREAA